MLSTIDCLEGYREIFFGEEDGTGGFCGAKTNMYDKLSLVRGTEDDQADGGGGGKWVRGVAVDGEGRKQS